MDNLKAKLHQGALTLKGHQGELQNLNSIHAKEAAQLQNMHYKKEQLNSELTLLSTPLDEQGDALQTMLLKHNTLDEEQKKLHSELGEIEHQLEVIEKGQQGINAQIHQMQQNIQASQVECEGSGTSQKCD